jgi:hypothetical protein
MRLQKLKEHLSTIYSSQADLVGLACSEVGSDIV